METQKTLKNQNNTEKKDQSWRYHTLSFQTILQSYSHQNSMTLAQKQTHRTMQQNREPRNKLTHMPHFIYSTADRNFGCLYFWG